MEHLLIECINRFSDITIEVFLFAVAYRWFRVPADRKRTEVLFLVGFIGFLIGGINVNGIRWLGRLIPYRYDLYVYDLDLKVFHAPGFIIGRFLDAHMWIKMLDGAIYNNVTLFGIITFTAYLYLRGVEETKDVFITYMVTGLWAICLYVVFPVAGPVYAFGSQFPYTLPTIGTPHLIILGAIPNGVPSVHIATALVTLWFLRRWWWGQIVGSVYLIGTVVATLGLGEHYVFDLLCAVPYSALVLWLTQAPAPARAAIGAKRAVSNTVQTAA